MLAELQFVFTFGAGFWVLGSGFGSECEGCGPGLPSAVNTNQKFAYGRAEALIPRMTRVWFDVTAVASAETTPERAAMIVRRIRQLDVERIIYGSDAPATEDALPRARWAAFRALPLTEAEFQTIAANVPPYMR